MLSCSPSLVKVTVTSSFVSFGWSAIDFSKPADNAGLIVRLTSPSWTSLANLFSLPTTSAPVILSNSALKLIVLALKPSILIVLVFVSFL